MGFIVLCGFNSYLEIHLFILRVTYALHSINA